jgi:uncharacterized protein (DUF697 family)
MSDAKPPPAKPRRRRLYQEIVEEPAPVAKPAAKKAAPPAAKKATKAAHATSAAKTTAPAKPAAAAKASASPAARTARKPAPRPEAPAAAEAAAKAAEQPAVAPPIEGEFIAAAEKVRIETAPTAVTVPPKPLHDSPMLCLLKAKQAVRDHALLSGGAMVIPIPLLDMAAEAAIQVRMVKRLAEIYGVDFGEERAKTLVVAALGGFSAGWAAGSLLRYASFATYFTNFWPSAILSAAITYAIGQVFIHHFDKGGSLHDLSPEAAASILKEKAMKLRRKKPSMEAAAA